MDQRSAKTNLGGFLENAFGEFYLPSVNRDVFNVTGSGIQFERQYHKQLQAENTFFIISGTDSGLLIRWLLSQGLANGSCYLFVEQQDILALIHSNITDLGSPERIGLCALDDWNDAAEHLGIQPYLYTGRVSYIRSIAVSEGHYPTYMEFDRSLKCAVDYAIWNVKIKFALFQHMETQLLNIPDNYQTSLAIQNCLKGYTGIVLAGGPSLDESLPWVLDNRDSVFVIAVSRISNRLQEVGIKPDVVVSIDPTTIDFAQVKQMLLFDDQTVFIHGFHATPPLVSQWPGRSLYIGPLLPWASVKVPNNLPQYGPTVTNAALHLAIEAGCNEIILAGVDLCFSQDGFTHAQGSYERKAGPMLSLADQVGVTYGGWDADTKNEFLQAGRMIEKLAKQAGEHGTRIYNASLNALRLEGVDYIDLKSHKPQDASITACEALREVISDPEPGSLQAHYDSMQDELKSATSSLRAIRKLATEALDCNARLFGRNGKQRDYRYKHKMDQIEDAITKKHAHLDRFIKGYALADFARIIRPDAAGDWTDSEVEAAADNYYNAYLTACDKLTNILDNIIRTLQQRKLELDANTPLETLMDYWNNNNQTGRSIIWAKRNASRLGNLREDARKRFEKMKEDFHASLTEHDPEWQVAIGNWSNLNGIPGRARNCFQQKDVQGLQRLLQTLKQSQDRHRAEQLEQLIEGYLLQLNGNSHAALDCYANITDADLREDKLLQTALLELDIMQLGAARTTLETLCKISPIYIPFYADLLRTTGDIQGALDAYADYLEFAPTDIAALLKLGQFYSSIGINEGAELCYTTILEYDPENAPARRLLQTLKSNSAVS